jgi:hypothetical protein
MSDLDAILKGEEVDEPVVEDQVDDSSPEDPTEEVEASTEGEEPEAEESAEEVGETPAPKVEKEEPWTKKAVLDERRKRQELEAKLKELEAQKGEEKTPDMFEDAEGYTKYMQQQMQTNMLNMSEFMARREFPDLDEKVARFEQMVQDNPMLYQKVMNSPSPYHEVVEVVRKAEELDKMSDIDSYKTSLREQIRAEVMAEMEATKAKTNKGREQAKSVPKSLAGQVSQGAVSEAVTDDDLQSILGR